MPRQTSEEQPNHRHLDQCFTRLHFSLVVLTLSPGSREIQLNVRSTTHQAPGFNRGCLMGVPQLPIPTLLWLDTTQLTPARDRPHLPKSLQRRGTKNLSPASKQRAPLV